MPQLALAPTRLAGSVMTLQLLPMFLIRNYVPNWTTTPPAPTIASTAASIASTIYRRSPSEKDPDIVVML